MAWIDNLPGINPPGKPDTLLGVFHQNGYLTNYNDNVTVQGVRRRRTTRQALVVKI